MKEIHFFSSWYDKMDWEFKHRYLTRENNVLDSLGDYEECEEALSIARARFEKDSTKYNKVYVTTQMLFLDTDWIEYGFRIFVHDKTGQFEIKLGEGNERTNRYIRPSHMLWKMWRNGEFIDVVKKEEEQT